MHNNTIDDILTILNDNPLQSAVLSSPKSKEHKTTKITIRPILIKGKLNYQASEQRADQVFHKNLSKEACIELICKSLIEDFKQALIQTEDKDYHILSGKKQNLSIIEKPAANTTANLSHNRPKHYVLEEGKPVPFLIKLGIMNSSGKVHSNKRDKFKQINRFLEIVSDILPHFADKRKIHVLDFGCGKAYLTFALYHYLHHICSYEVEMTGLDLKQEVINNSNSLAKQMEFTYLNFLLGDINSYQSPGKIDLMVTLHACDTATDAAIEKAVRWNTDVILSVPCCQHELYSQVANPDLLPMLQHGILKERFAALATDAARGKLLEALGYKVQIMEFIDPEHTPKNILIRAVRQPTGMINKQALAQYQAFKKLLNIYPSLEKRFEKEL